jgi:hypothetical protein
MAKPRRPCVPTGLDESTRHMIEQAVKHGPNMRKLPGEYELPAEGRGHARLVGYFELGKHEDELKGEKKTREKVELVFELSGPNHPPRDFNGEKVPQRIYMRETIELRPDSEFLLLFRQMNRLYNVNHFAELLGKAFHVHVFHFISRDHTKKFATLKAPGYRYAVASGWLRDETTQELIPHIVEPPVTPLRAFLWDYATREVWDALYVDGEYPEVRDPATDQVIRPARSKNILQDKIRAAKNWPEHHLYADVTAHPLPIIAPAEPRQGDYRPRPEGMPLKERQDENWRILRASIDERRASLGILPLKSRRRKSTG